MFERFHRSWELVKASASVLRSDKGLIVFPLVSAIAFLLVTATFVVPAVFYAIAQHLFAPGPSEVQNARFNAQMHSPLGYIYMFLFYLAQYSVIFFANTALIGAALVRLRGGQPTVSLGFRIAFQHLGAILGYAVLASTVGMILRTISERSGSLGRFVVDLMGFAWSVATYLVAPVLITENVGPVEAVKRSTALLKRTWGEQIIGNAGLGTAFGLILLVMLFLFMPLLIWAASLQSYALIFTIAVLFVVAMGLLILIQSALSGIYTAAVYLYASEGFADGPFTSDQIRDAFRRK